MSKNRKLALNSGIQTNQILTNDDEVCIQRLSSILLAVGIFDILSWTLLWIILLLKQKQARL